MDGIDMNFRKIQFNGSFAHEDVYRQDAGPEIDAAWEALGVGIRPFILPDHLAAKSGLTQNHVQVKLKSGGGYPVFVEGLHQLHCLNLLRKSLYYNYDYYHSRKQIAFSDSDNVLRFHVSHCLDVLGQRLMCSMDIGVFGSVWINTTNPHSFVDFNTKHTCRDFDAIKEWVRERQMPEDTPEDLLEPPSEGVRVWEVAP